MRGMLAGRARPAIAVAILVVLVAGGGYALASGGGTITACIHKGNGTLYIRSTCHHRDKTISWSKVGPRGPQGATGATGPAGAPGIQGIQGVPGPRGPSDGYGISKPNPTGSPISLGGGYTTVASETVPAGSYYASEDVEFHGTTGTEAFCYLVATPTSGTATYVGGGDILAIDESNAASVSGSSSGLITTPAQTVLNINCASIGSGAASIQRANLTALAVGAAH